MYLTKILQVIQEYLAGRVRYFACGKHLFTSGHFWLILELFTTALMPAQTLSGAEPMPGLFRAMCGASNARRILELTRMFAHRQMALGAAMTNAFARFSLDPLDATDPRDRVFAFLNVALDTHGIVPDYSNSCGYVYMDTSKVLLTAGADVLDLARFRSSKHDFKLPSWVVDWTSALETFDVSEAYAAGSTSRNLQFRTLSSNMANTHLLDIRGVQVGKVTTIQVSTLQGWREIFYKEYKDESDPERYKMMSFWASAASAGSWIQEAAQCLLSSRPLPQVAAIFAQAIQPHSKWVGHQSTLENTTRLVNHLLNGPALFEAFFNSLDGPALRDMCVALQASTPQCLVLEDGTLCITNLDVKVGDIAVVFLGFKYPFLLRSVEGGTFRLLGPMYVHGIMNGEGLAREERTFTLI
jgi:hypothetical protein